MTAETLNGDIGIRVNVDTAAMDWAPSPSPSVWRKRVHRVGPEEAGQVTSVVRYDAGSDFPAHDHPDGEEILVLDGTFTDDRGDWPTGTYLLNPEGYRHAPSSRDGCVLFVKLRQFPGLDREQIATDTNGLEWLPDEVAGVDIKPLYAQARYADRMRLERWPRGFARDQRQYPDGAELFIIEGGFSDETGQYGPGAWIRLPAGGWHSPRTEHGCTLYIKEGGHTYLR